MVPNPLKIDLWGSLGWLWGCSWPPSAAGATTRAQKVEKCTILGSPKSSKMNQKPIQNRIKMYIIFHIEFRTTFSRYWEDFGSQNLSKMRGLRVAFSTSLRICEKRDFERQYSVFAIFFHFRSIDFPYKNVYFSTFVSKVLWRHTFHQFGSTFGPKWRPNWRPNGLQNRIKNQLKFKLIF